MWRHLGMCMSCYNWTWLSWGSSLLSGANFLQQRFSCEQHTQCCCCPLHPVPPFYWKWHLHWFWLNESGKGPVTSLCWISSVGSNVLSGFRITASIAHQKQLFEYLLKQLLADSTSWDMLKCTPTPLCNWYQGQPLSRVRWCSYLSAVLAVLMHVQP